MKPRDEWHIMSEGMRTFSQKEKHMRCSIENSHNETQQRQESEQAIRELVGVD
jgi:hypothetical protein